MEFIRFVFARVVRPVLAFVAGAFRQNVLELAFFFGVVAVVTAAAATVEHTGDFYAPALSAAVTWLWLVTVVADWLAFVGFFAVVMLAAALSCGIGTGVMLALPHAVAYWLGFAAALAAVSLAYIMLRHTFVRHPLRDLVASASAWRRPPLLPK
jgi:hypothetical protein